MAQLEIACFNAHSAFIAQEYGADRIELCDGFEVGGTTPSNALFDEVRNQVTIPLYVMIRPRGGDFCYSDTEWEAMKSAILHFKQKKADGFVFGILHADGTINTTQNKSLVALAHPLPCTFHRAFDAASERGLALEKLIDCGFTTVLTSGLAPNVTEGKDGLAQLVTQANSRITIMPGGGLRSTNLTEIKQHTQAVFFHSSAITTANETADAAEIQALKAQLR
jgi:copper homeostasis protein